MIWSNEAEQSVIGALMLEDSAWDKMQDVDISSSDFYGGRHKLIFSAISELAAAGKPVDIVTLAESLDGTGDLELAGGAEYLTWLVDATPSTENVAAYAEIVVDRSQKRQYQQLGLSIADIIENGASVEEIESHISGELSKITTTGKEEVVSIKQATKTFLQDIDDKFNGTGADYTSGIKDFDALMKIQKGRLMVIAGRPAMGKSTLGNTITLANAKAGIPGLVITAEMPASEATGRMISACGNVDMGFINDPKNPKYDDQWSNLSVGVNRVKDLPVDFVECSMSPAKLKSTIRGWCRKSAEYQADGKAVVMIDYLGLMKYDNSNRVHGLGEITKALKSLCLELGIPILLLHQLNRGVESRTDNRPTMSDLRDSGEIEEDADQVVFPYRDEVYNEDTQAKGVAELIVVKSRNSQPGTALAKADLRFARFGDLNHQEYQS